MSGDKHATEGQCAPGAGSLVDVWGSDRDSILSVFSRRGKAGPACSLDDVPAHITKSGDAFVLNFYDMTCCVRRGDIDHDLCARVHSANDGLERTRTRSGSEVRSEPLLGNGGAA